MFEELGLDENTINNLIEEIKISSDPLSVIAKSSLDISKVKELFVIFRAEFTKGTIKFLSTFLLQHKNFNDDNLIQRFHSGDKGAFKIFINALINYLLEHDSKLSKKYDNLVIVDKIYSYFNDDVKNYLCCAIACILSNLPNAAYANIDMALLKILDLMETNKISDNLFIKKGELKRASEVSKKANTKRHTKNNLVKEYAINLFLEGNYPSARNAAQQITEKVIEYAHNDKKLNSMVGTSKRFTSQYQAVDCIERWLGEYNKKQKNINQKSKIIN